MPEEFPPASVVHAQTWSLLVGYVDLTMAGILFLTALLFSFGFGFSTFVNAAFAGGPTLVLGVLLIYFGRRITQNAVAAHRGLYVLSVAMIVNITTGLAGVAGQFPYGVTLATAICVGLQFFYFLAIRDLREMHLK